MQASSFPAFPNPPEHLRVRGLLCADEHGQVQVVAPELAIIDPVPLATCTQRALRGLPIAQEEAVSAIPGFYQLPTVIHQSLSQQQELALATDLPGQYVRATGQDIADLCLTQGAIEACFSERLVKTPADRRDDQTNIDNCIREFTALRIQSRLDETLHIPPLPEAARRIIALQQDPNYDLDDVVVIIEADPALAARIMGWANSALYAANPPAHSLRDGIMRILGFDVVFHMALGMALGDTLNVPEAQVNGASSYWVDALYSAAAMEALSKRRHSETGGKTSAGHAYLAGLLSSFGTLILGHVFAPQYATICQLQNANPHLPHTYIDQHVLSLNREVIAANLLHLWELPTPVTDAIRDQYVDMEIDQAAGLVGLLKLVQEMKGGQAVNEMRLQTLGISRADFEDTYEALVAAEAELGELAHIFSGP